MKLKRQNSWIFLTNEIKNKKIILTFVTNREGKESLYYVQSKSDFRPERLFPPANVISINCVPTKEAYFVANNSQFCSATYESCEFWTVR